MHCSSLTLLLHDIGGSRRFEVGSLVSRGNVDIMS